MAVPPVRVPLRPADTDTHVDLSTFVGRALRADPDGAARLVGHGEVLAVYVSPVHGGGGPVVLGLRTLRLRTPAPGPTDATVPLDVTVPLELLAERLARSAPGDVVDLPAAGVPGATWAGTSPPRRGWEPVTVLDPALLRQAASAGIAEVTAGAPAGSGAAAVATLRARVWGRDLVPTVPGLPAGVAFAALALGFAGPAPAAVYRAGPWWRVTTSGGHLLARRPLLDG